MQNIYCLVEQKETSVNFHWLSEHGCKQRYLSMELSGTLIALTSFEMQ